MELSKAIEILSNYGNYVEDLNFEDRKDAANLGTEALKTIKIHRDTEFYHVITLLPGETLPAQKEKLPM